MTSIPSVSDRLATALARSYRVERELGQGGMATVYLAHDLKHERDVAIKVLHPDLGAALGAERFLSEIKTTAKLQHPHILALLDSGEADGLLYYVMPFVRGETLRARMERERQLPLADALMIAREVADALQAAHTLGIVHRDIKPENILLQDGHALVADFGIALAVQQAGGQRMTQTGLSLGTPQYMSPEQAMGERAIDARSDIYALGAVTYEMLAGDPPFTGSSVQAIVAKVLSEKPTSLCLLRDTVPRRVDRAVARALAKLAADRQATVKEFGAQLTDDGVDDAPAANASDTRRGSWLRQVAMSGLLLIAGGASTWALMRARNGGSGASGAASSVAPAQFVLEMSPGEQVPNVIRRVFSISADGSTIVYVTSCNGSLGLRRRRVGEIGATSISGTRGATNFAVSPDGQWVAFERDSVLYKVSSEGGTPVRLATIGGSPSAIEWTANGDILYGSVAGSSLMAVPDGGGAPTTLVELPKGLYAVAPIAVPGSDVVLFSRLDSIGGRIRLYALSRTSRKVAPIDVDGEAALGALNGRLLYVSRTGDLLGVPFDLPARKVTGTPTLLISGVYVGSGQDAIAYAALSHNGHLVYHDAMAQGQLVRVDPQGRETLVRPDTQAFSYPRYSPDDQRIAVSIIDRETRRSAVWVLDRASGIFSVVADGSADTDRDRAEWSPDGKRLFYRRVTTSGIQSAMRSIDGSDAESVVSVGAGRFNEIVMLPDGRHLLARVNNAEGVSVAQRMYWWTLGDTARTLIATPSGPSVNGPRPSPNGQWVAYSDQARDVRHVSIMPFPGPGPAVRVDQNGAGLSVWRPDGRGLLFVDGQGITEATLAFTPNPVVTSTRRVIDGGFDLDIVTHANFDVGRDGSLLLVRRVREPRTIMIRDFAELVRRRMSGAGN